MPSPSPKKKKKKTPKKKHPPKKKKKVTYYDNTISIFHRRGISSGRGLHWKGWGGGVGKNHCVVYQHSPGKRECLPRMRRGVCYRGGGGVMGNQSVRIGIAFIEGKTSCLHLLKKTKVRRGGGQMEV